MLGRGFNRLMRSTQDEFFGELGIPAAWSESNHASTLTNSDFEQQRLEFEESEVSYKWQWFADLDVIEYSCPVNGSFATGLYLTKIDITAAQTPQAQE